MSSNITFNVRAYCKILLHCAKYPHCAVNGVLLSKATSNKSKDVEFVDAIPLFHVCLNLTPMAEIALMQIDEIASKKGLVISGYYMASDNIHDNSIEKAYNRITEKIGNNFNAACVVVVDNSKVSTHLDNVALKVAQYTDGGYKQCETHRICLSPDTTLDVCSYLLESKISDSLNDFDDHLDNLNNDWLNPDLNKEIENYL